MLHKSAKRKTSNRQRMELWDLPGWQMRENQPRRLSGKSGQVATHTEWGLSGRTPLTSAARKFVTDRIRPGGKILFLLDNMAELLFSCLTHALFGV